MPVRAIDGAPLPVVGGALTSETAERVRALIARELGAAAR
jgi:hypothetical protein